MEELKFLIKQKSSYEDIINNTNYQLIKVNTRIKELKSIEKDFDKENNNLFISKKNTKTEISQTFDNFVIDFDKDNNVVGLEILDITNLGIDNNNVIIRKFKTKSGKRIKFKVKKLEGVEISGRDKAHAVLKRLKTYKVVK